MQFAAVFRKVVIAAKLGIKESICLKCQFSRLDICAIDGVKFKIFTPYVQSRTYWRLH